MNATDAAACFPSADALFGPVIQDCPGRFDFTLSFEQYFLSIAPVSLLLIATPLRLRYLARLPRVVRGHSLRVTKAATILIFAILQLALVVLWAKQSLGSLRPTLIVSSSLSFVASLTLCLLSLVEHSKSVKPSFILNAYLLLSLIFDGAILRTLWLVDAPLPILATFTASFALKAAIVILEAKEKHRYLIHDGQERSPEETSGLYNQGLFWWLNSLLIDGFQRLLMPRDLFPVEEGMSAAVLNERFWSNWNRAQGNGKYKLIRICIGTLRWPLAAAVFPRAILLAFTISQPVLLTRFLDFLERPTETVSIGYGLIAAYGVVYVGLAISSGFYWHRAYKMSTMLRGMLVSAIFQKTAAISITATDNSAAVTLMSTDVEAIVQAVQYMHEIWADILQIAIATYLLSTHIGAAAAGPIVVCLLALGATLYVAPKAKGSQGKWFEQVQRRVGLTSIMLGNMKSMKISGLTSKVSEIIAQMRIDETVAAQPFRVILACSGSLAQVPVLLSPVAAFGIYSAIAAGTGPAFEATRLFSSLSLIILLAQPLFSTFETLIELLASLSCFDRIQNFLVSETRREYRTFLDPSPSRPRDTTLPAVPTQRGPRTIPEDALELQELTSPGLAHSSSEMIRLQDASFGWTSEAHSVVRYISTSILKGQLTLIVGPVASGKSTLLRGILGEVPVATGETAIVKSSLCWCDQAPWLTNESVRKNIIGFNHFDNNVYQMVVYACDLDKDFSQLPNGDETIVGSKGISLSGGQKQRVSLARALYCRPQIALFDDILSGLDNHTSKTVCDRVFSRDHGLLRKWGTTIVLATQTVAALALADHVLCLNKDGSLADQGTFQVLKTSNDFICSICTANSEQHDDESVHLPSDAGREDRRGPQAVANEAEITDKRRQLGDFAVYGYYFAALGLAFTTTLFTLEIVNSFLTTFPTVWLKWWSDASAAEGNQSTGLYLGVYAAFQTASIASHTALCFFLFTKMVAKVGITLHHRLLDTVIRAPLSVFTSTDSGSITTRFSQDLGYLDRALPLGLLITIASLLNSIGQAALIASSTAYVAISFPFVIAVFYFLQTAFLRTSRQLRHLDLEEKAPVYTQFMETLAGLSTIRAFAWDRSAVELNHKLVDRSQKPFYLLLMVQRWLTLVLDLIVAVLALLVVGLAVRLRDSVSVGFTGVSLVQLITFADSIRLVIQWWTSLETSIGAVARIKRFSEETPDENLYGENHEVSAAWPTRGAVEFSGVSASYEEGGNDEGHDIKLALDGISVSINDGEKVGVVGRTGSGKSSLLLTLVRMLDLSSGNITIDGVDISRLNREEVRSRLIALTQDQFFLPGTVRDNIDPWKMASGPDNDSTTQIEAALEKVGLLETVQAKGGLDVKLDDADSMFSHGQKQLFFLARALLRKGNGKIVLLDEATSSIDHHTESQVQTLIRDEFRDHTVIAIAHRLGTIIDFDRVLVLDQGRIIEQGKPEELLSEANAGSAFRALWDAARRRG